DEDTGKYISQVVSNLDRPRPQVLIKVVFLEITHNDSSDIGIEGAYTKNIGNSWLNPMGFMTNFGVVGVSNTPTIVPTSITPLQNNSVLSSSNIFGLSQLGAGGTAGLYQIFAQDYQVTLRAIAHA